MPGLGKENIKVRVEKDTVIMKGEGQKEFEDDELGQVTTSVSSTVQEVIVGLIVVFFLYIFL
ncbi:hypothetical protein PHJA_000689000 [Phtheirospermum japonicum]|uniref:Uncharacterized protein n=1 Tax=Phtheirospermum japonicum TaxID=374723 RepID=A0A830BMI8_9LAMI|nr:hypothetical protein PHJA_000689000 [Phtheirospermum japonicum]